MKTELPDKYIPTLDGWRALAILGVMACHVSGYFFSPAGSHPIPRLHAYLSQGAIGVDIFFVLSGFLICSGLAREREDTGRINLPAFYLRRAFRILPPFLLYLATVGLLATLGFITISKRETVACLFFFRNFARGGWYTAHFWTLSLEEHFYLLFPSFLVASRKHPARWTLALLVAATVFRTLNLNGDLLGSIVGAANVNTTGENRINELILGAWFALLTRSPATRRALRNVPPAAPVLLLSLVVYCVVRPFAFADVAAPLALALTIVWTSLVPNSRFGAILEAAPFRWVGRMSYSLYLWQQLFFVLDVVPSALPLGFLQRWPAAPVLVVACAAISYYFIEKRCIRIGKQLSSSLFLETPRA